MATFVEREFMNTNDSVVFDYSNNTVKFHFNPTPLIDTVNIGGNGVDESNYSKTVCETEIFSQDSTYETNWNYTNIQQILNRNLINLSFITRGKTTYSKDYTLTVEIDYVRLGGTTVNLLSTSITMLADSGGQSIRLDKSIFDNVIKDNNSILLFRMILPAITDSRAYVVYLTLDGDFSITLTKGQLPNGNQSIITNSTTNNDVVFQYTKTILVEWGNIILYNCKSDNNVLDKTIDKIVTLDGFYRGEISVMNPNLTIEINNPYTDYDYAPNYVYIRDFKRYYYINDITMVRKGLWELSCSVDVLMSFKEYILELNGWLDRSYNTPNTIKANFPIKDNEVSFKQSVITLSGIGQNSELNFDNSVDKYQYVISLYVGTGAPSGASVLRSSNITTACMPLILNHNGLVSVLKKLVSSSDDFNIGSIFAIEPSAAINSVRLFPFDLTKYLNNSISSQSLFLGNKELAADLPVSYYCVFNNTMLIDGGDISINTTEQSNKFNFLNDSFYTDFNLYIPFFGWVKIPYEIVYDKKIKLIYNVDIVSGCARALLCYYNSTYTLKDYIGKEFFYRDVNIAVSLPFIKSNEYSRRRENISTFISGIGVSMISGAISGNISGAAGGILSTTAKLIENSVPTIQLGGGISEEWLNIVDNMNMRYIYHQKIPTIVDNVDKFLIYKGCKVDTNAYVKNLKYFAKFEIIHCDNLGNATDDEKSQVEQILRTGIILPKTE